MFLLFRYSDYTSTRELKRITRWIGGHWKHREQAIAWDQWYSDMLAYRTINPLIKKKKELQDQVEYYITEEGKLKKRNTALSQEVSQEIADHAETKEDLGNKITGLEVRDTAAVSLW